MREGYGNDGAVESVEKQKQLSHSFHRPLEISQRRRDSHIPTAPSGGLFSNPKPQDKRTLDDEAHADADRNSYRRPILAAAAFQAAGGHAHGRVSEYRLKCASVRGRRSRDRE